jgi:uncharacterized membrane protein YcgQ (UPF0703/DUF1980 family)
LIAFFVVKGGVFSFLVHMEVLVWTIGDSVKKLLFLFAVLVVTLIIWLWVSQPVSQATVSSQVVPQITAKHEISQQSIMAANAAEQSHVSTAEVSQAQPSDQMLINTKSDPNVQPIDPDTDPANQSVKVN